MCEHCGCRGVEPIAELMDEHLELLDLSGEVRRHLQLGNRSAAWEALGLLGHLLEHHVDREERGLFTALREQGNFVDAVDELEGEHLDLDEELSELDATATDFDERVAGLLDVLSLHIDKENLGVFPVAVVTLGAHGWDTVAAAHESVPHAHDHAPAHAH